MTETTPTPATPAETAPAATSVSPNPRPKIFEGVLNWTEEQVQHFVKDYNAMVEEIEALAAHVLHLGGDPKAVVPAPAASSPAAPAAEAPKTEGGA